jgi:hypothetical protein
MAIFPMQIRIAAGFTIGSGVKLGHAEAFLGWSEPISTRPSRQLTNLYL